MVRAPNVCTWRDLCWSSTSKKSALAPVPAATSRTTLRFAASGSTSASLAGLLVARHANAAFVAVRLLAYAFLTNIRRAAEPMSRKITPMKLVWAALVVLAAALTLQDIRSTDYWWHLRAGQLIAETGAVPRHDPFTYTAPGARWI